MTDTEKELQDRIQALEEWREQYIKNLDYLLTGFNAFLMEHHNLDEGVDKWFDKYLKSQEKE